MIATPGLPEVVREAGGTRIAFPRREVPRVVGWVVLGFGVLFTGFMVFWMSGPIGDGLRQDSGFRWALIGFGLLGLPGLLVGLALLLAGAVLLAGGPRCTVWLQETAVVVREQAGPLRWTWRVPHDAITACLLADHRRWGASLLLRRTHGRDVAVAPGYGGEALARLVELLGAGLPRTPWFRGAGQGPAPGTLLVEDDGARFTIDLPGHRRLAWQADGLRISGRGLREQSLAPSQIAGVGVVEHGSGSGRYRALTIRGAGAPSVELRRLDDSAERWLERRIADACAGRAPAPAVPAAELAASLRAEAGYAQGSADPGRTDPDAPLPSGSPIRCLRDGQGLTIELPPRGLGKGNATFPAGVFFAVIGLGVGIPVLVLALRGSWRGEFPYAFGGFFAVFGVIGLILAIIGLRSGTRRTLVAVRGEEFALVQRDRLATRTTSASLRELGHVRVEPTGTTINDRVFYRIAIPRRDGPEIRFGEECSSEELQAVAARLRAMLRR